MASAVSAAAAALLLLPYLLAAKEARGFIWIACLVAMCGSMVAYSVRGQAPDWVPIIFGNALGWLALTTAWHGCRQFRDAPSLALLVLVPPAVWMALCLVPAFYDNLSIRISTAGLFAVLLYTGVSVDAWVSWRKTRLASLRDLALLFSLMIPYFMVRAGAAVMGLIWLAHQSAGWPALIMSTAIPFLVLSANRERAVVQRRDSEVDALLQDRAQLDRLLEDLPAVVYIRDYLPDGTSRLVYRGGDVERAVGWPAAVVNKMDDVSEFAVNLTLADRIAAYEKAMAGEVVSVEYQLRQPHGGARWVRASGRMVERHNNGYSRGVGYITDIQDLRDAEARATSAARMASLGEMAVGLAHELRQPMAIMAMAAENALDDIATGDLVEAQARLERIIQQNRRASDIIDNLRRFAMDAQDAGPKGRVPLSAAVDRVLLLMAGVLHRGAVLVERGLPEHPPMALAWPGAVEQILVNLLGNANDALAARPAEARWVRIEAHDDPAAGTVRLVVSDSAGGVPPEILSRVFQPFVTTKAADRGTGMGLAICHGMAKALGGTISVENQAEGAVFTVTLPAAPVQGQDTVHRAA
ncbi:MAG: ATP-binding protein [Alphaproteobacteria bacterium]|nr:ATP-binding protein [Alphaproteobacteria bacterium]